MKAITEADDITSAIQGIFNDASELDPKHFLSALVPINRSFMPGHKGIPFHLEHEMNELYCFANDFSVARLDNPPSNTSAKRQRMMQMRARCRILLYCHIMEAVFPMLTIYNLLRVLRGQLCCWTFYVRKSDDTIVRNKENECVCAEHPGERIKQITTQCKDRSPNIGDLLNGIWSRDLRNAFVHSQYCLETDCSVVATGCVTGVGKRTLKDLTDHEIYFHSGDIVKRYDAACAYLRAFTDCYRNCVEQFKDQSAHATESGSIWWDKELFRWRFQKE